MAKTSFLILNTTSPRLMECLWDTLVSSTTSSVYLNKMNTQNVTHAIFALEFVNYAKDAYSKSMQRTLTLCDRKIWSL